MTTEINYDINDSEEPIFRTLYAAFQNPELCSAIERGLIENQMSERELVREAIVEWLTEHGYLELVEQ